MQMTHIRATEKDLLFCSAINYIANHESAARRAETLNANPAGSTGKSAALAAFENHAATAAYEDNMTVKSFTNWFGAWKRYRVAVRELAQLSDRELADLGIARSEIDMVARQSAGV